MWTDARLDDAFTRLIACIDRLEDNLGARIDRLDGRLDGVNDELAASQRQFARIGWAVAAALFAQLAAGVAVLLAVTLS